MDLPQAPTADPLQQPTRARAFAFLAALRRPATIEEIARHLELHPTGVRSHLAQLEKERLVERTVVRGTRGRPHYEWAVAASARPHGSRPEAYRELARWLTAALAAGATTNTELESHGEAIGRSLAPADVRAQPDEAFLHVLSAMGFQPRHRTARGVTTYELCNCPYRDTVRVDGARICALHRGITRGLIERIEPAARLSDFTAKDPDRAGCLIEISRAR